AMLGVARLVLLGQRDSGLPGWPGSGHRRALVAADPLALARRIAELADAEGAATVVHDDEQGIYGHPDHRATARIGATAAELTGATAYATTIDREHLHVVARDVHHKRAAILAHASQVGPDDVPETTFAAAYGYEWYRRTGVPGVLDRLGNA